ncbi:class I SAM-dependent methyltransferase [Phenylobacterium sp.]|uniref:class I SAM-dependent methyltransferase n=1 Tax=Phenylobacterium sp. TaxID=1871053 RepID=UPI002810DE7F|nr:class I SAM-dependent methyltransferase [Phenylobacterium sp.]
MSSPPQSSLLNPLYQSFLRGAKGRPPIDKLHHYFDVYHKHLDGFRGRAPTILEIGVQNGGALHMWKDYFGEGARVFGVDVDPACEHRGPPDSKVFIGSQADPDFLRRVVAETGPLDVVIDDGGHTANQMIVSFETLYPHMKSPGVYLVEDVCTQFWGGGWLDDPQGRTFIDYARDLVSVLHEWTGKRSNFGALRTPPHQRAAPLPASDLCRATFSVCFYDSIVVIVRRNRPEPWIELRIQDPEISPAPPRGG